MGLLKRVGKLAADIVLAPFEEIGTTEGLNEKNLDAFLKHKSISEFLGYRYYEEFDDRGIFHMHGGEKGFIFRIYPPSYLSEKIEVQLSSLFDSITINGTAIQFMSFASQNIEHQICEFEDAHPCAVNVRNRDALEGIVKNRANSLRKWSKESMLRGLDIRIKDYVNLISVVYPKDVDLEDVINEYDAIRSSLGEIVAKNFAADELVTLLRELFHNEKGAENWNSDYDSHQKINSQITGGGLEVNTNHSDLDKGFVVNNANYVTSLTTQQYPATISLDEFNDFFFDRNGGEIRVPIYGPFIATLTVVIKNVDEQKAKALSKARHDLSELLKLNTKQLKANPALKDRLEEVQQTIKAITLHSEVPLDAMWNLVLFDTNKRKLKQSVSNIKHKFSMKTWKLVEESVGNISLFSTLYSLPLQYNPQVAKELKRFEMLFKSNNASIAPLIGDSKGYGRKHFPLVGRTGQLQWFDPYASDGNYNICGMGGSGSGKSFTIADFSILSCAMNGKIRIIDSLPSYKRAAELVGGDYIDFDDKTQMCLNFFTNIMVKYGDDGKPIQIKGEDGQLYEVVAEEDLSTIIPMLGMMCGVSIVAPGSELASDINSTTQTRYLASKFEEAIRVSFRSRGRNAGLEDVREYLIEVMEYERNLGNNEQVALLTNIVASLATYATPDGMYYKFFNGVNNMDLSTDYVVVELTKLEAKGIIYPIVLMAIANQIVNEFFGDEERYKMLIIDEFWKFIDNVIIITFTEELARKVRKMNGLLITITQSIEDYFQNKHVLALYKNSSWKLMLKQPADSIDMAVNSNKMSIGMLLQRLLKSIHKRDGMFGEFAIVSEGSFMLSRLKVDLLSEWMYSTLPAHKEKIRYISAKLNLTDVEAASFCAYQQEHPAYTDNQILEGIGLLENKDAEQIEKEREEREEFVKNMLQKTLKHKNPMLYAQSIFDNDKNKIKSEVTSSIKGRSKEEILPLEFLPIAAKEGLIRNFDLIVAKKAIDLFSLKKENFSINIAVESLLDQTTLNEILDYAIKNTCQDLMTIEIPFRNVKEDEIANALTQSKKIKKVGVGLSNDNMDLGASNRSILAFPIDYMKLTANITTALLEDELAQKFAEMIITSSQINGVKICFVNISDEHIYKAAKDMKADLYEGYFLSEKELLG